MPRMVSSSKSTRKDAITAAAARLFREKGYPATGMRDLARHVGVEAASLYNHIGSKAELLQLICMRIAADFTAQLAQMEADTRRNSIEKVEAIVRFHVRMWVDRLDEVLVATSESRNLEEPFLSQFLQERRQYVRRLENIIDAGIRAKEIRPIEPYVVVLTLMSAVRGIEFWHRTRKNVSAQQLEESMVTNLVAGLRI